MGFGDLIESIALATLYFTIHTAPNSPFNVAPHIGVDLQDSKLSIDKSKRHELINFFSFRHYL